MRVETRGFEALADDFDRAGRDCTDEVRKVVSRGSLNIKRDWAARWRGLTGLPDLARSITYSIEVRGGTVSSEIGPEHGRSSQAELAHLIEYEYGGARNAPQPGGAPALRAEQPRLEAALEARAADLVERNA